MGDIWSILMQTLTASLAAAVLLCAKSLFQEQLSPRWQYGVWGILALRVLLPAGALGWSLFPTGRLALEAVKTAVESCLDSALCWPYGITRVYAPIPIFLKGLPAPGSVTDVLFYVYAAGVGLSLLWFLGTYLHLRRALKQGRQPEAARMEQLNQVCARYGLKAPPQVAVCPQVESAFVCGLIRPVLVLPEREVDDKVLLHELMHLKYGDVWAGVGMCLLRCLHWCNPFLWYCWDRAQNDGEALCDQRVLERLEGEERREYGKILLSMAGDRYARAPGTSSMANGGTNIKRRIASIARFKRYPAGVTLGAGCIGAVLAVGCLTGTAQARGVADLPDLLPLALAQARLNRPTTPAGALDTYVKAVLTGEGLYLSMVTPWEEMEELVERLEEDRYRTLDTDDFASIPIMVKTYHYLNGKERHSDGRQAEWSAFDFLPQPDGSYTGLLVLDGGNYIPAENLEEATSVLYQFVQVAPQDGSWTVTLLSEWEPLPPLKEADSLPYPEALLPCNVYVGEAGDLRVELDYWYELSIFQRENENNSFGWTSAGRDINMTPTLDTLFTKWHQAGNKRVTLPDGSEAAGAYLEICPLYGDEWEQWTPETADQFHYSRFSGNTGTGGADYNGGAEYQTAPSAIAVKVRYEDRDWYTLALPERGSL